MTIEKVAPAGTAATRNGSESTKDGNQDYSSVLGLTLPAFTLKQYQAVKTLPKKCTERVLASTLGVPASLVAAWRRANIGLASSVGLDGSVSYRRGDVLSFVYRHVGGCV
ncbi:hypothetical protein OZX73_03470 [Bifidobacterium sp. ESL0775]|uniref:hypothetical protein n=1 Tax=Bifidobacterium sp. ESL0775 TaxID=2983230 RepID=UPI0023F6FCDE|nr:hypothetical protein [Bifidobacterium sp. ESL0775]WEV69932.1 hypothetical protein OZX73_03470 [Bifidobacterium sp. ESL0775]